MAGEAADPYPVTADGSLPEGYKYSLDPLDTLTFVAARTKKIALGPSVLDIPYYNPVTLARRLTTIDVLSNGRLRVGLGLGWSKDEMDATGADMKQRGAMADEFLQVLKAIWTTNPVKYQGKFYRVPESYINSEARAETTSADLHGGVRSGRAQALGNHGGRVESSRNPGGRNGADVRCGEANGQGCRAGSFLPRLGRSCQPPHH